MSAAVPSYPVSHVIPELLPYVVEGYDPTTYPVSAVGVLQSKIYIEVSKCAKIRNRYNQVKNKTLLTQNQVSGIRKYQNHSCRPTQGPIGTA